MNDIKFMAEDLKKYLKEEILGDLRAKQIEIDISIKNLKKESENNFKRDSSEIAIQYEGNYTEENVEEFKKDLEELEKLRKNCGVDEKNE